MVDVYIRYLRKKIDEGFFARLIHTVARRGLCPAGGSVKRLSIKARVTFWYTLLVALIALLAAGALFWSASG